MAQIRVGISGWTYAPWRGSFYPEGLVQKRELEYASRKVSSIEINGTFYGMQKPKSYQTWHDQTPEDFCFSLKGPKYMTHVQRLKEVATPLANFLASGLFLLGPKMGPILWQFPPSLPFLPERFEEFMKMLPHDSEHAAALSKNHSEWMADRCVTDCKQNFRIRHAIEVRHSSFKDEDFIQMLRTYNIALVIGDTAGRWPYMEDLTADFVYVRLHGDETVYPEGYTDEALDHWAARLHTWSLGEQPKDAQCVAGEQPKSMTRDVFAYLDNDTKDHAPFDALALQERIKKLSTKSKKKASA